MGIAPIGPIAAQGAGSVAGLQAPQRAGGGSFADALAKGIDHLSATERKADEMLVRMATGGDVAPHDVMIATQKAALTIELAVAVRNKALEAYREIMNLQL